MKSLAIVIAVVLLAAGGWQAAYAADKHLFYIQGCCVKGKKSPIAKDYQNIVRELESAGFKVYFDLRTAEETDSDAQVHSYAAKVAELVKELLAKGVAPSDITISGYSLGSMTSLVTSSLIANPKVNYVLLAGCPTNANIAVTIDYAKITGRILSITDSRDDKFGSCAGRIRNASDFKEISLDSGEGHKLFRLTDPGKLKLWMDPLGQWAAGQ